MRILHVVNLVDDQASYGGPLTVAVNQCKELRARGHEAELLAGWRGHGTAPSQIEGVPAHLFRVHTFVPRMRFSGLFSLPLLQWVLHNARRFDVAHLHTGRDLVPLATGAALQVAGVPYVTQTHGMVGVDLRPRARLIDRALTKKVLGHAIAQLVLTDDEDRAMAHVLGVRPTIVRLPNGIAVPDRRVDAPGLVDVLFLARLHPRKRVMDFARAAAALIAERSDARFSVVGPDDGELPALQSFISGNPAHRDRIHYEGALDHAAALERLRRATVFVLPSQKEPFPMTLLEALALGVPSICTTSCGIAADLYLDDSAVVVEPGAQALTSALRELLDDEQRRQELSVNARRTAQDRFSMQTVGSQLLTIYDKGAALRMSDQTSRQRLLWITNIATPYRAPLWAALGQRTDLTVALLAESEPNRQWHVALDTDLYETVSLEARPLTTSGDSVIYAPSLQLLRLISTRPQAIILDGWESPAYLLARWWARRIGVPLIASYRSTLTTHRFDRGPVVRLRRWFFQGADAVLTAGPASTEAVTALGIPKPRITEGFNTVDVTRFAPGTQKHHRRFTTRPGHHFLYVGQFIPRKNVDSLIMSFAQIRKEQDTLTLVGAGPLRDDLEQLSKKLNISEALHFTGHLDGDAVVAAYTRSDTLVLPSYEEVWGLVVNEALCAGLHAVVSTKCGIGPSIEGMTGVFMAEPTCASISSALELSRSRWAGPITNASISRHTPEALAEIIVQASAGVGARTDRAPLQIAASLLDKLIERLIPANNSA